MMNDRTNQRLADSLNNMLISQRLAKKRYNHFNNKYNKWLYIGIDKYNNKEYVLRNNKLIIKYGGCKQ